MNILCLIPARGKSKRIPNKNLRHLLGKPLIAYTIEKALKSKLSTKVAVSTDEADIAAVAGEYGADIVMRPDELARDESPIDEALRHALRYFEQKDGRAIEIAVLLQANVPVRKDGEIDEVINKLIENKDATAATTVYAVDQRPEWAKIIDKDTGLIKPFMEPTELYRKQTLADLYLLDGAITAVRREALLATEGARKVHAYMGERIYPLLHARKYATEVDEEEDFELAEYYLLGEKKQLKV